MPKILKIKRGKDIEKINERNSSEQQRTKRYTHYYRTGQTASGCCRRIGNYCNILECWQTYRGRRATGF